MPLVWTMKEPPVYRASEREPMSSVCAECRELLPCVSVAGRGTVCQDCLHRQLAAAVTMARSADA